MVKVYNYTFACASTIDDTSSPVQSAHPRVNQGNIEAFVKLFSS